MKRIRIQKPETTEYMTWKAMRMRCSNPNDKRFARYGGRGISVCPRWDNFKLFLSDMGPRPTPKHSLDRIDNNADYSPHNCRWATAIEQMNNVSRNRLVEYQGERLTLAQVVRKSGTPFDSPRVRWRLAKGWSVTDALFSFSKYSNSPKDRSL